MCAVCTEAVHSVTCHMYASTTERRKNTIFPHVGNSSGSLNKLDHHFKSLLLGVVPLPNRLFMAYKWGVILTTWSARHEAPVSETLIFTEKTGTIRRFQKNPWVTKLLLSPTFFTTPCFDLTNAVSHTRAQHTMTHPTLTYSCHPDHHHAPHRTLMYTHVIPNITMPPPPPP